MRRRLTDVVAFAAILTVMATAARSQVRDARPPLPAGTSIIRGVVVSGEDSTQRVRRAIVTVKSAELPVGLSSITGDNGEFFFNNLPAGQFTITASKRGYVTGAHGASRAGRPGTPARVASNQAFEATITLFRGAVVTGQIRDERGNPLAGLRVFAIDADHPMVPVPTGDDPGTVTDDRGVYRLYGLVPRTYLVTAITSTLVIGDVLRRTTQETDAVFARLRDQISSRKPGTAPTATPIAPPSSSWAGSAPTFYPGTAVMSDATRVKLVAGEVREGLDFPMHLVPVTTIEGVIVNSDGPPPASVQMRIDPVTSLQFFALGGASPQLVQPPQPDGRFKYGTIIPGHYVLTVRANRVATETAGGGRGVAPTGNPPTPGGRGRGDNQADTLYGIGEVDVTGQPVSGLAIRLQPGSRLSGRVVFDGSSPPATPEVLKTTVTLQPAASQTVMSVRDTAVGRGFPPPGPVTLRADGSFEVPGVPPGKYKLSVVVPPGPTATWWFRRAMVGNRDVLDSTLDVGLGTDLTAALTLTDRHNELAGTLISATGLAAPDYFVVAMPVEQALRLPGSRRIRSTRPATDGAFSYADLPAGNYLIIALTDLEPDDLQSTQFLADISAGGVSVTIADGERKRQDLRITLPQ